MEFFRKQLLKLTPVNDILEQLRIFIYSDLILSTHFSKTREMLRTQK